MKDMLDQIWHTVGAYLPSLLGALAILVVGWLIALAISKGVRKGLEKSEIDDKVFRWISGKPKAADTDASGPVSKIVFWVLMLFVLVGVFQVLGLTLVTEPINRLLSQVFEYAPRLLAGALLILIAWVVAAVVRAILSRVLTASGVDSRLSTAAGAEAETAPPISKSISDAVFWLILLLFLPAITGAFGLEGLLQPVSNLTDQILGFLPNLLAAALILVVGWFVARIVQRVVSSFLAAVGTDRLSERIGLASVLGTQRLSSVLGTVVYALILIPILISALNALALDAVTEPASEMLDLILGALPSIFAAAVILIVSFVIGRVVSSIVANILSGIGFDTLPMKLGVTKTEQIGDRTASGFMGSLVLIGIMLFAASEAAGVLGFDVISDLIERFVVFAGDVLVGVVILGIGLYLANLVARAVRSSSATNSGFLAALARTAIIVFAGAMALDQMGVANDIINLAFGLLLGAVAVAAAVAFGIGGREIARRQLEAWRGDVASRGDDQRRV